MTTATLTTAVFQLESLISSISADDEDTPTPCSEWVVRDLIDHVVHTTAGLTQMVKGQEVDWSAPVVHHDDSLSEFRQRGADLLGAADDDQLGLPAAELAVHTWDLATALGRSTDDLDPAVAEIGPRYAHKPFFSREGWDIELVDGERVERGPEGGYGEEGAIVQALAPLPDFGGHRPVIGSWIVGDAPVAMSIREDDVAITRDLARFIPHAIV